MSAMDITESFEPQPNGMEQQDISDQAQEQMDDGQTERTEAYGKLLEQGLNEKIAAKVDDIFKTGKLTYEGLDERAFEALKEFPVDGALVVLSQYVESSLDHVSNKSAYLCGMMKTYRQKQKASGAIAAAVPKGPDEEKIKAILNRTQYTLDVTTGQRKYGGPPPGWEGPEPVGGCEVFCGKVPKEVFEDDLILLFEKSGKIYDLRLMMDPMTGTNRGYAFVTYTNKEEALQAVKDCDGFEIRPGRKLKVNISVPNLRLFVGNIPKSKGKEEIMTEFAKLTVGLTNVIIYSSPDDKKKNRGFCFLEYDSHKSASLAKKKLGSRPIRVWNCDIIVDWADPQEEPDSETMSKVKVLYVRNLKNDFDEERIKQTFEVYGPIVRIKKLKDYAFVHYEERDHAIKAMEDLNGTELNGSIVEISLAKPPSDKKKKEEVLRARERRMMGVYNRPFDSNSRRSGAGAGGARTRAAPSILPSGDYEYDYDYFGYDGYRGGYNDSYYDDYYQYDDYYYDYPPAPARGRPRPPPLAAAGRGGRPAASPARGLARGAAAAAAGPRAFGGGLPRGGRGGKANLQGKRKFEGGNQVQGGDTKRRYQSNFGQQGMAAAGYGANGGAAGNESWYQDTYNSGWQ